MNHNDPMEGFFDAWGAPTLEKGSNCLTDAELVMVAKSLVKDESRVRHTEGCYVCGAAVKTLKDTISEPGKNLQGLIAQVKADAERVISKRHTGWRNLFSAPRLIPLGATLVLLLAVLWGPIIKNLPTFRHNQVSISLGKDEVVTTSDTIQIAIATLSSPDKSPIEKQQAWNRAKEVIAKLDASGLDRQRAEALNAQINNLQALYTPQAVKSRPNDSSSVLEAEIYTTYERYKEASTSQESEPVIIPPVDPNEAVQRASTDIKVKKEAADTVLIESRDNSDDYPWFARAMQNIADRNRKTVKVQSGQTVQSFNPRF